MRISMMMLWTATMLGCGNNAAEQATGHVPAQAPPPNASGGFRADLPPVTVPPGEEVWPCFLVPIEIEGGSRMVAGGTVAVGSGLHHGNVLTRKKTGDGLRECPSDKQGSEVLDVADGGTLLFGSSTQAKSTEWLSFPAGMAFRLDDGYEIVARMHYVNTTPAPLTVEPHYQWYTIPEADVTQEIAPFLWIYRPFTLPPMQETTVQTTCTIDRPMKIVTMLPHTHARGIDVAARFVGGAMDGTRFLESPGYNPEKGTWVEFDTPVDLSQGTGISFSCSYRNDTDREIDEGPSSAEEMCMIGGYAYPPEGSTSAIAQEPDLCATVAVFDLK